MDETPITFREPSYVIFDETQNAVRTTRWGNLAIFSTRAVAEQYIAQSAAKLKIIPVMITPLKGDRYVN